MAPNQLVDLGTGEDGESFPREATKTIKDCIERYLGVEATERNGFRGWDASLKGRTITAFAHQELGLNAIQIEMKPSVRVHRRRLDASMYGKPSSEYGGPYEAPSHQVQGMIQALVDFIEYLKNPKV